MLTNSSQYIGERRLQFVILGGPVDWTKRRSSARVIRCRPGIASIMAKAASRSPGRVAWESCVSIA
jgi:hypothetical protein